MGWYIDRTKFEDFSGAQVVAQLTDDTNDGAADAGAIERLIAVAEGMVDGALRATYVLPLVGPLDPAVESAALLVVDALLVRRFPGGARPEDVTARWTAAMDYLTSLRKGEVTLSHQRIDVDPGGVLGGAVGTYGAAPDVYSDAPRGFGGVTGEGEFYGERRVGGL